MNAPHWIMEGPPQEDEPPPLALAPRDAPPAPGQREARRLPGSTRGDKPPRYAEPQTGFHKSCKYCDQDGLAWGQDDLGGWRLVDEDGLIHECPKYPGHGGR